MSTNGQHDESLTPFYIGEIFKWWPDRGYGFASFKDFDHNPRQAFVHVSECDQELGVGDQVKFTIVPAPADRGPAAAPTAKEVLLISRAPSDREAVIPPEKLHPNLLRDPLNDRLLLAETHAREALRLISLARREREMRGGR